ncbi:naphthalene 1,2-dioxygenase, partial [Klebsiella pneumoniae]
MLDETFTAFILTVLNKKQSFIYETKAWRIAMSWIGVCDAEQVQEDFPYSGNIDG